MKIFKMVLHFVKERNYFSKILAGMRGITLTNYLSEQEIVDIFCERTIDSQDTKEKRRDTLSIPQRIPKLRSN